MLGFFSELGCHLPPFPFIAHSRGWSAEDMERNVQYVMKSGELRTGAADLVARAVELSKTLLAAAPSEVRMDRGGRKAHQLDVKAQLWRSGCRGAARLLPPGAGKPCLTSEAREV